MEQELIHNVGEDNQVNLKLILNPDEENVMQPHNNPHTQYNSAQPHNTIQQQLNKSDQSNQINLKLKRVVENIEKLEEEKTEISSQIRDVYREAKMMGFCNKAVKRVISYRKKDKAQAEEDERLFDLYLTELGAV